MEILRGISSKEFQAMARKHGLAAGGTIFSADDEVWAELWLKPGCRGVAGCGPVDDRGKIFRRQQVFMKMTGMNGDAALVHLSPLAGRG
jgi:hypothetical protein